LFRAEGVVMAPSTRFPTLELPRSGSKGINLSDGVSVASLFIQNRKRRHQPEAPPTKSSFTSSKNKPSPPHRRLRLQCTAGSGLCHFERGRGFLLGTTFRVRRLQRLENWFALTLPLDHYERAGHETTSCNREDRDHSNRTS